VKDLLAMQRPWQIVAIAGRIGTVGVENGSNSLSKSAGKTQSARRVWSPWVFHK